MQGIRDTREVDAGGISWWYQEAIKIQLQETLAGDLLKEKRKRLNGNRVMQWETEEGGDEKMEAGILGQRQDMPRRMNDLVW